MEEKIRRKARTKSSLAKTQRTPSGKHEKFGLFLVFPLGVLCVFARDSAYPIFRRMPLRRIRNTTARSAVPIKTVLDGSGVWTNVVLPGLKAVVSPA